MTEAPSLESWEGQLREQATQEVVEELYAELRENAEVEVLFGQPAPTPETAPQAMEEPASEEPADPSETPAEATSQ